MGDVLVLTGHTAPPRGRPTAPAKVCPGSGTPAVLEGGAAPAA